MEHDAKDWELFARCASGFEHVVARELKALGARRVRPLAGGASFFGSIEDAYRACMWLRSATRVQVVLARIGARDADELYENVRAIPWERELKQGSTLAVRAHGGNGNLRNTQFIALKVKDAVCDRLREVRGSRPDVDSADPDFSIDVSVRESRATVYLNVSGASLHKRGYREDGVQTEAPLKETLAAGMLLAAGWDELSDADAQGAAVGFVDPMCGSGTLLIEAALIALRIAAGSMRTRWGFQGWARHEQAVWERVVAEAEGLRRCAPAPSIIGCDVDSRAVRIARENAARAGVSRAVRIFESDAANLLAETAKAGLWRAGAPGRGLMAVNPPYGRRMGDSSDVRDAYRSLHDVADALPPAWSLALITPDESVDALLGEVPSDVLACYNGPIEAAVRLYLNRGDRVPLHVVSLEGRERTVHVAEANSEQFAARLRKVAKERAKWARKNGVACYRIYDVDLPDYSFAIDVYHGRPLQADAVSVGDGPEDVRFVRVVEYQAPSSVDPQRADRRFADALSVVPAVLDVEDGHVFSKVRKRAKGGSQYRDARSASCRVLVKESGYTFEVDLGGYLDTGLFLDHRMTRSMVGDMAQGRRFLNLFAYTGTASVHAAGAGAAATTTVDLSRTYLAWAERNMAINGFSGAGHTFVNADVRTWLDQEKERGSRYDVVFCDPPTFSNSKRTEGRTFDVARDHVALLQQIKDVLAPGGVVVFSCNLRTFALDERAVCALGFAVRDVTAQTIPHDFSRTPIIHRCYVLEERS